MGGGHVAGTVTTEALCEKSALEFSHPAVSGIDGVVPPKKKPTAKPLSGAALIKEVCRRIRVARRYWDAHNNRACRGEREKALALYETLTAEEREKVPQVLRVWLRYRSEKYFGDHRTPPGG
jgi:hypothetical protein